ncbi:hypothetical protein Q3G72_002564 [Acer saccharum]|nr:hypothetical protein Q3G72_002564 [Acer saccharum]
MIFIVIFGGLDLFFCPVKLGDGSRKHIRVMCSSSIQIPEKNEDKSDFEQQGALEIQVGRKKQMKENQRWFAREAEEDGFEWDADA